MTVENERIEIVEETEEYINFSFPEGAIWECSICGKELRLEEDCNCRDC